MLNKGKEGWQEGRSEKRKEGKRGRMYGWW